VTNSYDLEGTPVSEEEVAVGLGFADVPGDRDCYLWHVKRMRTVLWRIEPTLTDPLLRLAVGVVLGRAVDWKHQLKGWWEGP
jgi:hypothetical protein